MNDTLRLAQLNHDHAAPPDETPFLETEAGQDWQADAAYDLIHGEGLWIGDKLCVSNRELADTLGELFMKALADGRDTEGNLGEMLLNVNSWNDARSNFTAIMGEDYVYELAREMVAPYAEMARKQMEIEDDR